MPRCARNTQNYLETQKNCVSEDSDYGARLPDYMAFGGIIFICGDACSSADLSADITSMLPHRPDVDLFMLLNTVWRDHLDLNLVYALDHNRRVSVKTNDPCRMSQNINIRKSSHQMYSSLPAASERQESSRNLFRGGGEKDWLIISQLVRNVNLCLYLVVLSHKKHMNRTRHFPKHSCSLFWKSQTSPFPVTTSISFHSLRSLRDRSPFRERDMGCPSAVETEQKTRKPTRQKTYAKESLHKKRPTLHHHSIYFKSV